MTNLKEMAEILLRAHNSEATFNSVVDQMNSSSNTLKEDVSKLMNGARLEVTFDIDKICLEPLSIPPSSIDSWIRIVSVLFEIVDAIFSTFLYKYE